MIMRSVLVLLMSVVAVAAADPTLTVSAKEMANTPEAEGRLLDGAFSSVAVDAIQRLKFAVPASSAFTDSTRCVVDIETAKAGPVALMLVVRTADGAWAGNLQGEQAAVAGRQTLTYTIGSMKLVNGPGPVAGGHAGHVIFMAWDRENSLRLHGITIGAKAP